jgi:hypothetical protein
MAWDEFKYASNAAHQAAVDACGYRGPPRWSRCYDQTCGEDECWDCGNGEHPDLEDEEEDEEEEE